MAVGTEAEQDEVESGDGLCEELAEEVFILAGGAVGVTRAGEGVDLVGGDGDVIEEGFAGHAIVALGVVGGHAAFVGEEDMGLRPGEGVAPGGGGGVAAGEDEGEAAAGGDGAVGLVGDDVGGGTGEGFEIGEDFEHDDIP